MANNTEIQKLESQYPELFAEVQKLKSQYPEFFSQFPPELIDFVFSIETANKIAEICLENKIEDEEKVEKIAYQVTLVLLNQVPKENLSKILEGGAGLNQELAERVAAEIENRVFSQIPRAPEKKEGPIEPAQPPQSTKPEVAPAPKAKIKTESPKRKKDIYREPIE